MSLVVVDTDVVSYTFKKDTRARGFRRYLIGNRLIISFMTLAELRLWGLKRRWGAARRARLDRHLLGYGVHYADDHLCRLWAEVTRNAEERDRPVEAGDAWIAASALALGVPLITHNAEDYAGVPGLTVLSEAEP